MRRACARALANLAHVTLRPLRRIAVDDGSVPLPPTAHALYGWRGHGVRVDAIAVQYDHWDFVQSFEVRAAIHLHLLARETARTHTGAMGPGICGARVVSRADRRRAQLFRARAGRACRRAVKPCGPRGRHTRGATDTATEPANFRVPVSSLFRIVVLLDSTLGRDIGPGKLADGVCGLGG